MENMKNKHLFSKEIFIITNLMEWEHWDIKMENSTLETSKMVSSMGLESKFAGL